MAEPGRDCLFIHIKPNHVTGNPVKLVIVSDTLLSRKTETATCHPICFADIMTVEAPANLPSHMVLDGAASAMDLCMNYEAYSPADKHSISKAAAKSPFLVRQISAAMYDTLAALDQIGLAKQQLGTMLTLESKNARDMKSRLIAAQRHAREAVRFSPILALREEFVDAMNASPPGGIGRRARESQKKAGQQLAIEILSADKLLKKLVPAIGRDRASVIASSEVNS